MSKSLAIVKQYASSPAIVERFNAILGESEARPYIESIITVVSNSSALQECAPETIMHSALRAATLRLSVDPALHQAHLVPFKGTATLIVDYRGLVELMERTGQYKIVNVSEIYEGEIVKKNRITGEIEIKGEPIAEDEDHVIGWLAYTEKTNGIKHWTYMTNEECDAHGEKYSRSYNSKSSAWNTDRQKMRRKTALRVHANRWGSYSPGVRDVLSMSDDIVDAEVSELPQPPQEPNYIEHGSDYEKEKYSARSDDGYDEMTPEQQQEYREAEVSKTVKQMGF